MNTDVRALLVLALVGVVAGFLAFLLLGGGAGLIRFLITGVLGALVGGVLLDVLKIDLGIRNELARQIVTATIGAIVVVLLARIIA